MLVRPTFSIYAPFYQSSHGYGLAVQGTTIGSFDLAYSDPEVVAMRFETGNAPESHALRFHVIYGPDHATILDEYTALIGRPFVPPAWAFHHWRWRGELRVAAAAELDGVAMNADLVEDLTMYEQLGIPAGVYVLDRPVLAGEFGFARFAWDEERLPNPTSMMAALRQRGYRVLTWSSLWACGSGPDDNGTEAFRLGFLAPSPPLMPACSDTTAHNFILDPTNPDAAAWWTERVAQLVDELGVDGIKLDRGEEFIPTAATDVWADGRSGREVRNAYPVLQAKIHYDALARARKDDFLVFTRSGYTGAQRWAIVWGGDTPGSEAFGAGPGTDLGLRSAIIGQLRAAFLGYPIWGSDTSGYYRVQGPRSLRAVDRVLHLLGDHGDRRRRRSRAVAHAHGADLRHRDDRDLSALYAAPRAAARLHRRGGARGGRSRPPDRASDAPRLPRRCVGARCSGPVPVRTGSAGRPGLAERRAIRQVYLPEGSWSSF